LVLSSLLIIALTNGARLFVAWLIDLEQVAYYAFYLRFALILLMVQQIFLISFFKKIYQSPPYLLDQLFALLSLGLTLLGLLIWWAVPYFFEGQFSLLAESILLLFTWSTWSVLHIQELALVNLLALFVAVEVQFSLLEKQCHFRLHRSKAMLRFSLLFFSLSYLWIV